MRARPTFALFVAFAWAVACTNGNMQWRRSPALAELTLTPGTKTLASTRTLTLTASGGSSPYLYDVAEGAGTIDETTGVYTPPRGGGTVALLRATDERGRFGLATITVPASGSLDTSFSDDGIVTLGLGERCHTDALALQSDGKIVAAGYVADSTGSNSEDFLIIRLLENGALDTSFNSSGLGAVDVARLQGSVGAFDDRIKALTIQPDGKILTGGWTDATSNRDFALARFSENGTMSTDFTADGVISHDINLELVRDEINALHIDSDGGILAAGFNDSEFALLRLSSTGTVDTTFGMPPGGAFTMPVAGTAQARSVTRLSDDTILLGGIEVGMNTNFAGVRVAADGNISLGTLFLDISGGDFAFAFAKVGGDKFFIAGSTGVTETDPAPTQETQKDALITKLSGLTFALDTTFNGTGIHRRTFAGTGEQIQALAADSDGTIIAAGYAESKSEIEILRFLADGSLDTTFATSGVARFAVVNGGTNTATGLVIDSEGRLVITGEASPGASTETQLHVSRLWP